MIIIIIIIIIIIKTIIIIIVITIIIITVMLMVINSYISIKDNHNDKDDETNVQNKDNQRYLKYFPSKSKAWSSR